MQHLHAFLPQPAAGVGYPLRELYKSCSRPRRSLAHSRVLEVPPVQLIPGFLTPRRRSTSGPATPRAYHRFHPPGSAHCRCVTHSMTSSARPRTDGGTVRPSALAVLRLTTSSKVVGCWTGRSAGLVPLRILPA